MRRRVGALLLAFAFGCASLGGVAHRAIVQHVACEHGQLVELAAPLGRGTPPATTTLSSASAHDHHHCTLDGFSPPAIHRVTVTSVAFDPTWRTTTVSVVVPERALLLYAPKTSPPV